jgi:hypothetical protein
MLFIILENIALSFEYIIDDIIIALAGAQIAHAVVYSTPNVVLAIGLGCKNSSIK